jgi:hypothetical protein
MMKRKKETPSKEVNVNAAWPLYANGVWPNRSVDMIVSIFPSRLVRISLADPW